MCGSGYGMTVFPSSQTLWRLSIQKPDDQVIVARYCEQQHCETLTRIGITTLAELKARKREVAAEIGMIAVVTIIIRAG